jgi:hypothetical protein
MGLAASRVAHYPADHTAHDCGEMGHWRRRAGGEDPVSPQKLSTKYVVEFRFWLGAAVSVQPDERALTRFPQDRTGSWHTSLPRSPSRASTFLGDCGKRMQSVTARRILSGLAHTDSNGARLSVS